MIKFKVGDIIKVKNKNDLAYQQNNFYEVLEVKNNYIKIKSLQTSQIYQYNRLSNFVNKYYRKISKTEKILYLSKNK